MLPLNEQAIRMYLTDQAFLEPIHIHCLKSVDSTNRFLKDQPFRSAISVCCSETQTQGRGRFDRSWYSPAGENIYLSLRWSIECPPARLSTLGLVISLAILNGLNKLDLGQDIHIKWPNDLLWQGKKLSGCLIELLSTPRNHTELIIGIGLNVNSKTNEHTSLTTPWCSLYDMHGIEQDRNRLIAFLIVSLKQYLTQWLSYGFSSFLSEWHSVDGLFGQWITVSDGSSPCHGLAQGINENGALILVTETGAVRFFSSGETTCSRVPRSTTTKPLGNST
jgi:BirA family transcriptional regulator, biotin operon repressor / biotin---[acetyl-CoA-carboxylase] ligase